MREWIQPDDQKEQNIKFELLLWFDPFFFAEKNPNILNQSVEFRVNN